MKQNHAQNLSEEQLFKAELARYYPQILNFIKSHLHHAESAADLTQDCILQAYTHFIRQQYTERQALKNYLFCLAYSRLIDYCRRRQCREQKTRMAQSDIRYNLGWISESEISEDEDKKEENDSCMQRLLSSKFEESPLSISQKRVLEMRYSQSLTFKEIAFRLNSPISTIISRHNYALKALKLWIKEEKQVQTYLK